MVTSYIMSHNNSSEPIALSISVTPTEKQWRSSLKISNNPPCKNNFIGLNKSTLEKYISKPPKEKQSSHFQLFKYSTTLECILVVVGIVLASLASICITYSFVIYGEFTSLLIDRSVGVGTSSPTLVLQLFGGGKKLTNATKEENLQAIRDDAFAYGIGCLVGALAEWLFLAIAVDLLNHVALKQTSRIRKLFLEAILRQDISWYDTNSGNNFATKMTEDLEKMKDGMGEKIAIFTFLFMTFTTGIIASFLYGWKLTLVVIICCPLIIISTVMVAKIQGPLTVRELKAYSAAGAIAEEVFSGIRTVLGFSGQHKETERFSKLLIPAEIIGRKKGLYSGISAGIMWFIIYACDAIAMWYGVKLILADRHEEIRQYTTAVLVIVLFGIIMGAQNLGFASPHVETFSAANGAAQSIFSIIERKSAIDSLDDKGIIPLNIKGNISLQRVHFRYPTRQDIETVKDFSLNIKAGQTVALVGASGCGKSTILQLLQRLYDPLNGSIRVDGINIKDLNVAWFRSQIGVVGQEPVLFATTIEENIRYGNPSASVEDIQKAARMANCHDFISKLPKGYDTLVGERGAQMSGGQKQRIAIARALVRNPKILLLDEATSALDSTSEKRVQNALEAASKGRTTLVVSHRLSTITNADLIIFIKNGTIAEQGTHDELMEKKGFYFQLVNITKRKEEVEADSNEGNIVQSISVNHLNTEEDSESEDDVGEKLEDNITCKEKRKSNEKRMEVEKYKVSFKQLMKLNAPEWRYLLTGCVAAIIHGAICPVWAILFGDFFGIMSDEDAEYVQSQTNQFSYIFIVVGLIAGLGTLTQNYMFNMAGVKMTSRLRKTAFKTIISQNVSYFDSERNSVGALCARLAGDCSNVQGATGARIGMIVQAISALVVGSIVAFVSSWNLTLVTLVTLPFVCLSVYIESRFMKSCALTEKVAVENASQVAVEAISNIRTVASLGLEKSLLSYYNKQIDHANVACRRKFKFRGTVFGMGQASLFLSYGVSLYYGGWLVANKSVHYKNVIKVSEALIFGSWMLGHAFAYAPNVSAAILSAGRLLKLFNRAPAIQSVQDDPYNTVKKTDGDITYEQVDFQYPTRKGIQILQNLNLDIKRGTTVALVGPSGSGKSTCVQLLLRYYDPNSGSINISGIPTTDFSMDTLRSSLGLVSQEPVLFDRTIAENIAYGNNFRDDIPMAEIMEAAKKANIHHFIVSLPQGYSTSLGNKGAQLSGGQKQRIAIARALLRNPKTLILDEATSALDLESEKVVQEALDAARSGRTCITIAHRLTTVRDANMIYVLKRGLVVEKGTHDELMLLNGVYAKLYVMQQVT
ncbi:multidrug resistance protein homolog 49-like isoform X1 [Teleopsis dalmanni]|uniref:multidrug resistance protein homolog 49-like isoform X1 n=2 Tax=Teleopsis dalmanni TaxID=139649 RepID=UPI000D3293BB|nr:multidrug resistance protein homolog 49-like isoform X1 [Teleopsis dalmanni]